MIGIEQVFPAMTLVIAYAAPFLGVLILVVFAHECGHFIAGRLCGAGIETFSIGMGPELIGFSDRLGTRWRFSALPIGGYVRFASKPPQGGANASAAVADPAGRSVALTDLPLGARAAIIAAGPAASVLAAIVIFSGLSYFVGETIVPSRVGAVSPDSAAERAGFLKGDEITGIDDRAISTFPEMSAYIGIRPGEAMTFQLVRDGRPMTIIATPTLAVISSPIGPQRVGKLGLVSADDVTTARKTYPSPLGAVRMGLAQAWGTVSTTQAYLTRLVSGRATTDQLSGPVRIAQIANVASTVGAAAFLQLAGLLSLSLGLMNLLPVPMLDGGQLLYCAIEAVLRRPISRRAQEYGLRFGAATMLGLTVFVTFNDLRRLFSL